MSHDGHDTKCTYRKCAHPASPAPCPFVRDEKPVTLSRPSEYYFKDCKHEWRILRSYMGVDGGGIVTFYCIFCRKIEEN